MKNIHRISVSFLAVFLCCSMGTFAQEKIQKYKKSFKVNKDVIIDLDTRHTNIVFETWNRKEVEIEAVLELKNTENQKRASENWSLSVNADSNRLHVKSGAVMGNSPVPPTPMPPMEGFAEMMGPMMEGLIGPLMEGMAENPLPPNFMANVGSLNFDYEAYEKDGEAYMEKWEAEVEKKFGKDFEKDMEAWGKEFEKRTEARMKEWEKKYEKKMEAWGEKFGKEMEAWGEQFGKQMEASMSGKTKVIVPGNSGEGKRTIIIKMPKDATLQLNVRHGEVKLAELTTNIKANLSHSKLTAETIDGAKTSINVSYAPVLIKKWNYGVLNASYVKNCKIENAKSIKLTSNSSDVTIKNLSETGNLAGTFGKLSINGLSPTFKNLIIDLKNSNLVLNLPDAPLDFTYNGSLSSIKYPSTIKGKLQKNYETEMINGYLKSNNNENIISIKASYSEVLIK